MSFLKKDTAIDFCKNKVMLEAVLEKIYVLAYPIKINGIEFEDSDVAFATEYIESPENMFLIMEENKRSIMYGIADSKEKPKKWSPEDYYNALYKTLEVLYYLTGIHYAKENENIYFDYKHGDYISYDAIIELALREVDDDGFWNEQADLKLEENTLECFEKTVHKYLYEYISNEELINTIVKDLLQIWKEKQPLDEDESNELDDYLFQFSTVFAPRWILEDLEEHYDILLNE